MSRRYRFTRKDRVRASHKRRGVPPSPNADYEAGDLSTWADVWGWAPWDCGRRVLPHEHD